MAVKMVLYPALTDDVVARIRDLEVDVVAAHSEAEALEQIADADAFYGRITPALLEAGRNLHWIQATSAGLDNYFFPALRTSPVSMTNMRGIYSDVIADHVFAFVLSFARGMHIYGRWQTAGRWERGVEVVHLAETTLGIVGLGGIGLEVAGRGHVFGMTVLAVDPAPKGTPDYVSEIYSPDRLGEMLPQADFVVICVPHTRETAFMMDADALKAMKPGAFLINIGRGKVVDLEALTRALASGALSGAGLDVFEEEPLPAGHPLWQMEQVMITPHVAGVSPVISERRKDVIVENVRRFCAGEPLLNVVDKQKGYAVAPNPD